MGTAAPFYLHPAAHPDAWKALLAGDLDLDFAVINVNNGPGTEYDEDYYGPALSGGSRTRLVGYVDIDYGQRPHSDVQAEVSAWRDWYGITAIMLDRTPAEPADVPGVQAVVAAVRAAGADHVILNPGRAPDPDIAACGDVTCTVETDWITYRSLKLPKLSGPTWHLVHSVPPEQLAEARATVQRKGPAHGWVTDGRLPNPWGELPAVVWPENGKDSAITSSSSW